LAKVQWVCDECGQEVFPPHDGESCPMMENCTICDECDEWTKAHDRTHRLPGCSPEHPDGPIWGLYEKGDPRFADNPNFGREMLMHIVMETLDEHPEVKEDIMRQVNAETN